MALFDDILAGLTPQNGREFEDVNKMLERMRAVQVADAGEDATPGFGMVVQGGMPQKRFPDASAPSSRFDSAEPQERLESTTMGPQEQRKFDVPQTAPIVQNPRQAQGGQERPVVGAVPKMPQPDFWDRLGAFSRGYNTGGLVGAVADGMGSGLDRQVDTQNQTLKALMKMGMDPDVAAAATRNPELMKSLLTIMAGKTTQSQWSVEEIYDEESGRKRKVMVNKLDPTKKIPIGGEQRGNDMNLSAGDKKAIREAEASIPELDTTIESLKLALELNPKTFTGITAPLMEKIGTALPEGTPFDLDDWFSKNVVSKEDAAATREWLQLMNKESIQLMASTLKGATTNFELQEFVRILSDPSTPAPVRKRTIERMLKLAEDQRVLAKQQLNEMRGGEYYKPGGGQSGPAPAPAPETAPPPVDNRGMPETPPPNARRGKDNKIYLPDPVRPGKWRRWDGADPAAGGQ